MVTDRRHLQHVGSLPDSVPRPYSIPPEIPSEFSIQESVNTPLNIGLQSLGPPKPGDSTGQVRRALMDVNITLVTPPHASIFSHIKPNLATSLSDPADTPQQLTEAISPFGPIMDSYKVDPQGHRELLLLSSGKGPWHTPGPTRTPIKSKSPIDWGTLKYIKLNYAERTTKRKEFLQTLVDCYRIKSDV